jgi:hypothetical protein
MVQGYDRSSIMNLAAPPRAGHAAYSSSGATLGLATSPDAEESKSPSLAPSRAETLDPCV